MKNLPQSKQHVDSNAFNPKYDQSEDIIPTAPAEQTYQQAPYYHSSSQFSSPQAALQIAQLGHIYLEKYRLRKKTSCTIVRTLQSLLGF